MIFDDNNEQDVVDYCMIFDDYKWLFLWLKENIVLAGMH